MHVSSPVNFNSLDTSLSLRGLKRHITLTFEFGITKDFGISKFDFGISKENDFKVK
jgi:hypothetical protein